jgi:transposase, IS30 family
MEFAAAAREEGVSRMAGNNWSGGYKVYRKGRVVEFVSPLDRLAVREISPRYLSQDQRIEIGRFEARWPKHPADRPGIGRAASTVSRELRRNGGYRPFDAHHKAVQAAA